MSVILGINAYHAGAAAAVVIDGRPIVAIAEERLNRVKYYAGFPKLAIQRCLDEAGLKFRNIDAVAIGRDRSANLHKKFEYTLRNPTKLLNLMKIRTARNGLQDLRSVMASECEVDATELRFEQFNIEHHLAHIASSYFISDWDEAAGFSLDGCGDFVTCMMAHCRGSEIEVKKRVFVPHSIGSLYTMVCEFIGYRKYGDEGKVMGLAPLGSDNYRHYFDEMMALTGDEIRLGDDYFRPFGTNQGMTIDDKGQMVVRRHYSKKMVDLFGTPREPHSDISQRDMDLAFGLQHAFERGYFHLLNRLHGLAPSERVAMAGGCVLNSVANGKMFDHTPFRQSCIQPAAGDEGLALGAALYVSNSVLKEKQRHHMIDAYLGPEYSDAQMKSELERRGVDHVKLDRAALLDQTSDAIQQGNVVGWFQGRMEWGPRALGNRSILAHPGLPNMKDVLNARIKRREWFRPFAPSVLAEEQAEIFEHTHPSPFMMHVYKIKPDWREPLTAVNHVDDTGRLQTVRRDENELYYDLINTFGKKTGIPVILNTSFNENEPIVCAPAEAIDCFLRTKMDVLVLGPYVCRKNGHRSEG